MPAKNPGEAAKAFRLRRLREIGGLKPIDALWLEDFEERQKEDAAKRTKSFGASASGRKIKLDIEEHAQSVGTGTAASEAASAALMAKEEGRRLDALTINAVQALQAAVATYKEICLSLKDRQEIYEKTHIEMLMAWRSEFLTRVDVEADLRDRDTKGDEGDMLKMLLPVIAQKMGIDLGAAAVGTTKRAKR